MRRWVDAGWYRYLRAQYPNAALALLVVLLTFLGGAGSILGPLLGAIAFEFIRTYANKYAPYAWQMTLGIIMLLIILLQPGGLWAMYESVVTRFSRRAEGVERA